MSSVSQLYPLPLPKAGNARSKSHINSVRRGKPPMTSFMFSFLNTFSCDTHPEKSIYKVRLTFKCQTCLGYTTENEPFSWQKTMCVDSLNAIYTVHIAAFTLSLVHHRQCSVPLQTFCTSANFTSNELSYSTKKSHHKLTLYCLLKNDSKNSSICSLLEHIVQRTRLVKNYMHH